MRLRAAGGVPISLCLQYWMGSSVSEIATLIGVPENTVKSYLHRARRLLHVMLVQRGGVDVPEPETTDRWLREALSHAPLPSLSPGFDDRLAKRRQPPRRLTATGRLLLAEYAVLAMSLAIWVMRSLAINWPLVAVTRVAPVVTMAVVYGKRRGLA